MPELEGMERVEKNIFEPIRGLKTKGYQVGTPKEIYETEKEEKENVKEEYESQKIESNVRLVDYKLVVAALKEHTTEENGLENALEKLNVDEDSDARALIVKSWNNVNDILEKAKQQQSEIDKATAERKQLIESGESDGSEEKQKIEDLIESRKKTLGEVDLVKQRPQEDVDFLTQQINNAEEEISKADKIINENASIIESIQLAEINYSSNQNFYKDFYINNDEYIQQVIGEIDNEEDGIYTAETARQKSSKALMITRLRGLIDEATSKGLFSFIIDSLFDIEIHLLLMHGYGIEELPGGYDTTTKSSLYVPGKKVKVKTPDDTPDLKVSWDKNIKNIGIELK